MKRRIRKNYVKEKIQWQLDCKKPQHGYNDREKDVMKWLQTV